MKYSLIVICGKHEEPLPLDSGNLQASNTRTNPLVDFLIIVGKVVTGNFSGDTTWIPVNMYHVLV
ncbi:MAG TPA: hypothetical protein VED17_06780 [Nitrososphaerales archaeon]|nr:hypothetical protein [Nitrososphaerales archaeon]